MKSDEEMKNINRFAKKVKGEQKKLETRVFRRSMVESERLKKQKEEKTCKTRKIGKGDNHPKNPGILQRNGGLQCKNGHVLCISLIFP